MFFKYFGSVYLFYLASQEFKKDSVTSERQKENFYLRGVYMNLINPKVLIFFLAYFPNFLFSDTISIRIAVGSGVAFFIAQNLDVQIFDSLRKKIWYLAPLASSIIGSVTDTFLFFSIAFYATGIPWVTLAFGDLAVKLFIALAMLIPFRLLISKIKDFSESSASEIKN